MAHRDLEETQPVTAVVRYLLPTQRARLEPTPELVPPHLRQVQGSAYNHADEYNKGAARAAVAGTPEGHHLPADTRAGRSPLFRATLGLMAGHDRMSLLLILSDAYPRESFRSLDQALREMAVLFAAAGIVPKEGL